MKRTLILLLLLLSVALPLRAQFYSEGCESALKPYSEINTGTYRIVFPTGMDSLALKYASELESIKNTVGATCGFTPNSNFRRPQPVILYPGMTESNGSVSWTPRRTELITTPQYSSPLPDEWISQLCIHETRHVAQMQFVNSGYFRPLHWILGQISDGALAAVFPGRAFFEGDAVVAETSLTPSGRGRDADFLEYCRVCFAEGDYRDYWKWRYGSLSRFSPGEYEAGYLLMGGVRAEYDVPGFTAAYYSRLRTHFFPVANLQKTIKDVTGTTLPDAFASVCAKLDSTWRVSVLRRSPLTPSVQLTPDPKYYMDLTPAGIAGSELYAYGKGIADTPALYRVGKDGRIRRVAGLAYQVSSLKNAPYTPEFFYSESSDDVRWEKRQTSDIFSVDTAGVRRRITSNARYFNPSPSPDGKLLSVTYYGEDGTCAVRIISSSDGLTQKEYPAPENFQPVETEWVRGHIAASAISPDGMGIYLADEGWKTVLDAQRSKIKQLTESEGKLYFTCDRSGECELYTVEDGRAVMLTSSVAGLSGFRFDGGSGEVYCAELNPRGRHISRIGVSDLKQRESFDPDPYPMATKLSAGERQAEPAAEDGKYEIRRYSRLKHLLNVHSWAPCYVDYDAVADLSFEDISSVAGLGATVFVQNELSTLSAIASWHIEPASGCRNSGHVSLTYRGLYPVFEFKGSVNERNAIDYRIEKETQETIMKIYTKGYDSGRPLWSGTLKTYIPLDFSSAGVSRGVVPQLSLSLTGDSFDFRNYGSVAASVRAYAMRYVPSSCIYPRLGIGAEAGWSGRVQVMDRIKPMWYVSAYAYLPGILRTHGIKLSAFHTGSIGDAMFSETRYSVLPRGYVSGYVSSSAWPSQTKLTADYVFPFASLEWSGLSPVVYLRNLEGGFHFDAGLYSAEDGTSSLCSAGATLKARLENLLWVPFPTRIGVTFSHNFGSMDSYYRKLNPACGKNYIGFVFSVDL